MANISNCNRLLTTAAMTSLSLGTCAAALVATTEACLIAKITLVAIAVLSAASIWAMADAYNDPSSQDVYSLLGNWAARMTPRAQDIITTFTRDFLKKFIENMLFPKPS